MYRINLLNLLKAVSEKNINAETQERLHSEPTSDSKSFTSFEGKTKGLVPKVTVPICSYC